MYQKDEVSIFKNEIDKLEIDKIFSKFFPWTLGRIYEEKYPPLFKEVSNDNSYIWFNSLRKRLLIYGYVYIVGAPNQPYYGGDCSDVGQYITDYIDSGDRIWIFDRQCNWCMEFEYTNMFFYLSVYKNILNLINKRVLSD